MTAPRTEVLRHVQLKDVVYERLRQEIIEFTLQPGTPLREAELSRRLGVSKTPLREALVRLQRDNLVELTPYKGAVVSGYSRADLQNIYQLRELLEGACAREAAQAATPDDLAELSSIIRDTRAALGGGERDAVAPLFNAFDEVLYRQTRNPYIKDQIEALHAHLDRIGQLTVTIPGRFERSAGEHEAIFEAILRRDPAMAEQRMREHILSVMVDQLANLPDEGLGRHPVKATPHHKEDR
jgi:DNA-binding GntR family transcriptional regulator